MAGAAQVTSICLTRSPDFGRLEVPTSRNRETHTYTNPKSSPGLSTLAAQEIIVVKANYSISLPSVGRGFPAPWMLAFRRARVHRAMDADGCVARRAEAAPYTGT